MQSTKNEKLLVEESNKQLSLLMKEKQELSDKLLESEAILKAKVDNAMMNGLDRGKQIVFDEYDEKLRAAEV